MKRESKNKQMKIKIKHTTIYETQGGKTVLKGMFIVINVHTRKKSQINNTT